MTTWNYGPIPTHLYQQELQHVAGEIRKILLHFPDLSRDGFKYFPPDGHYTQEHFDRARNAMLTPGFTLEVLTAREYIFWIDGNCRESYGLKHDAERFGAANGLENHVSNGAAIVAAISLRRKVIREKNSPNCTFKRPARLNPYYTFQP